ncbi:aldolase [Gordoniibacillus kamchatkensis]|uniref:Aldolase n=1 Tax=Gordoniibacillus kamchatkensis TaxID=1590651 RepID=A0ABR5AKA0_9BACL|nr:aldolase/citrate lyase family protein [Paenibacillus sp. VKM B-2647]KIL41462.1 aldolase [Paenibacillus sp. VKM B-2647]
MDALELKTALKSGKRVYGTCIISPSPKWPAHIRQLGLDFVFIDTEHISIDRHQLSWMCEAYKALGMPPIVRIPSPDPYAATMVLDGGASGVIAPYVESVEQVEALRGAVKYRPLRGQKLDDILKGNEKCTGPMGEYLEQYNKSNILIVNIESRPALDALDDILNVTDLDAVLIGPHDLSCSLNVPEQYDHPLFLEAVDEIVRKARSRGIGAGIHYWIGTQRQIEWAGKGLNLLIQSSDITSFVQHLGGQIREMKAALGDMDQQAAGSINI